VLTTIFPPSPSHSLIPTRHHPFLSLRHAIPLPLSLSLCLSLWDRRVFVQWTTERAGRAAGFPSCRPAEPTRVCPAVARVCLRAYLTDRSTSPAMIADRTDAYTTLHYTALQVQYLMMEWDGKYEMRYTLHTTDRRTHIHEMRRAWHATCLACWPGKCLAAMHGHTYIQPSTHPPCGHPPIQ